MSLAVIAFVLYLAWRTDPRQVLARVGFALIIGGAVGNLIDRAVYGHVIDYVLFHTPVWSFAVFNLADAFITVGAALVVLEELLVWRREPQGVVRLTAAARHTAQSRRCAAARERPNGRHLQGHPRSRATTTRSSRSR